MSSVAIRPSYPPTARTASRRKKSEDARHHAHSAHERLGPPDETDDRRRLQHLHGVEQVLAVVTWARPRRRRSAVTG